VCVIRVVNLILLLAVVTIFTIIPIVLIFPTFHLPIRLLLSLLLRRQLRLFPRLFLALTYLA
jgi:hypothetical protein